MSRRLKRALQRFRRASDGAAAVEFAILAPLLFAAVIGVAQYGGLIMAHQQMHDGVASGALYLMRGGTNTTTAQSMAYSAWPNKPSDAAVTVAQGCTCAGVAAVCTSLCADGNYPQSLISISASGTYAGPFGNLSMSTTQQVRTQ